MIRNMLIAGDARLMTKYEAARLEFIKPCGFACGKV